MNTATAAQTAGVAVATIRAWCRYGAVTAAKQAGRWAIDPASLNHRITIGNRKARMTKYAITEGTRTVYRQTQTTYTIVRTDGTPAGWGPGKDSRIRDAVFTSRETAEKIMRFYENTPAGYHLSIEHPRADAMRRGRYWLLTSTLDGDPQDLRMTLDVGHQPQGGWPEGTTDIDILIDWANTHAKGAPARIAAKAEKDAAAEAEAAAREAREAQLAARRARGELATPRQVHYILQLLAYRQRTGDGGGFYNGPTSRAEIEEMSKAEASLYITSLTGDY
ncbi:hypothetical protein [Streptomyces sp. URMC 129]|uniref:hypothetical protein n=1 Tax=Streptomyces sp. URMC 129 TaxID=3423407 RepID=UPI003F1CFAED